AYVVHTCSHHSMPVLDIRWRDENIFASCSADKTIGIVDISKASSAPIMLTGHKGEVNAVRWSPDGTMLASASDDDTVIIWKYFESHSVEIAHADQMHKLCGHSREIYTVEWSPDGTKLATVSVDSTVNLWDAAS